MKVGLVGFARCGKTTIFNALTGLSADVGGFDAQAAIAVVKVPDPRVDALADIVTPDRTRYAEVSFLDFPPSAERKAALDTRSLAQMRELEALAQVVRAFDDPVAAAPADPLRDLRGFHAELILADMGVVDKRLERLRKERGREREQALLEKCFRILEQEKPLRGESFLPEEQLALAGFAFLSHKPLLVVYNVGEGELQHPLPADIAAYAQDNGLRIIPVCGKLEMEIAQLDEDERDLFVADLGLERAARGRFIRAAYDALNLLSFFTAGPSEARAWTVTRGTTAVRAAGKIHSDIERGFIRAEVIGCNDYLTHRGEAGCREAGKMRLEGRDYVVRDGDVVHFRFKV